MKISVIGLGKLGAPWAAVLASKGHTVVGIDANRRHVDAVNHGKAPVLETGLEELINESRHTLTASMDLHGAVLNTDVTFIVVATPSKPDGGFSLHDVLGAVESVARALKEKASFHLIVLTSTVMPGDMETQVRPALERHAGKRVSEDFGLCYNPEFVALGTVIRDMVHPDFILIGESEPRSGDVLAEIYRSVCPDNPRFARMNFINAEITKLAVNTFLTMKISYANMVARLCERLAGADVDVVTASLGLDSRIGPKYLKGAISYGGPCFPRDNVAFAALGEGLGVRMQLPEATDQLNREQLEALVKLVLTHRPPEGVVGILGLSYKPGTSVCEASAGLSLARRLQEAGVPLVVYDPAALEEGRRILGSGVLYASSAGDCARRIDVLVVTVPWKEFASLTSADLRRPNFRPTVIDCWRVVDRRELEAVANVVLVGVGPIAAR